MALQDIFARSSAVMRIQRGKKDAVRSSLVNQTSIVLSDEVQTERPKAPLLDLIPLFQQYASILPA